ncbi:hypothetical protein OIDMADRAFT_128555, partial [Oidiodendron maius Zn]
AFPSSGVFDDINNVITATDTAWKDAIKNRNAIFAFVLKNKDGETESWHIDLKMKGAVGKGLGEKPAVTLSLSDEDFGKLASGKAKPQRLCMSGKLKVKGNLMKAVKLETILFKNLKTVKSKL